MLVVFGCSSYSGAPASEITIAPASGLRGGRRGADLGGEGKLGGFSLAGSVDGRQRRRPRLSHLLQRDNRQNELDIVRKM